MNWLNLLQQPKQMAVKQYVSQLLQERYPKHEAVIERVSHALVTDQDVEDFTKMLIDIYEVAYLKCVEDHRKVLQQYGVRVSVTS